MIKSRLADLGRIVTGSTPSSKEPYLFGSDVPFLTPSDMAFNRRNVPTARGISAAGTARFKTRLLPSRAISVVCIGATIGKTCMTDSPVLTNQQINSIVVDESRHSPDYVYYLMLTMRDRLRAVASGAATPIINKSVFGSLEISIPDRKVQTSIGDYLRVFDDLIENNRRRIEILEEMARLLYREWFVHFRFPGHEDVELVDSDLGPIPEGWEVSQVADVAGLVRGRSYRRQELVEDGGLPFLNLKCIDRGGGFRKSGLKRYVGKFKDAQQTYPGDTVIAVTDMTQERNIVGQAGRVPTLDSEFGIISLDLARVLPRDSVDVDFLYGMFRFSRFSETVKEHANGTNVLHLSPDRISEHCFIKPLEEVQRLYGDAVRPMLRLMDNLTLQNEVLREARDLLLPRLVSGELDVSELDLGLERVGA